MSECPNPYRGKCRFYRPCYSRRCSNQNCRNKAAWRKYLILLRSCQRRPPQFLVTLTCPSWNGWNAVEALNRFFDVIIRQLARKTPFLAHWEYDGTADHYRHIHMLVQCPFLLTTELVHTAWRSLWSDEGDDGTFDARYCAKGFTGHCRPVDDVIEACRYVTKHGTNQPQITKRDWIGPLSGGHRRFFVASQKKLFEDSHYREDGEAVQLGLLESQLAVQFPDLLSGPEPDTLADTLSSADPGSLLDGTYPFQPRIDSESTVSQPWRRPRLRLRSILDYSIWPMAP